MEVREVMTRDVKTCRPETNLAAVAEIMWSNDCGAVPVLSDGKLVGILTDRDIAIALGTRNARASEVTAAEVASAHVYTCAPGDDVHRGLEIMRAHKIRRLPVVNEEGVLEGILCLNDIALQAAKDPPAGGISYEDVAITLRAICEHGAAETVPQGEEQSHAAALAANA